MTASSTLHLNVAELALSNRPVVVSTVLGSCVSVFLFSPEQGVGGVTHYALPNKPDDCKPEDALRYGNIAIPYLINEIYERYGVNKSALIAKIIGGSSGTTGNKDAARVGEQNVALARKILKYFGIMVQGESIGGTTGRKVFFHIPSGRVQVANLNKPFINLNEEEKNPPEASPPIEIKSQQYKILIVDDSPTIRSLLSKMLSQEADFIILPPAASAVEATKMIKSFRPNVITLDIHMPGMTGVEWLEKIFPMYPVPVVIISSLHFQEGNEVFRALELGAVDYIQKPSLADMQVVGPMICEKIRAAASAKIFRLPTNKVTPKLAARPNMDLRKIITIGASTGGTEAIKKVICQLPQIIPPILIVQHIPAAFSLAFAKRLNELCPFLVKEAEDGEEIAPSKVLIGPGGKQMKIERSASGKLNVRLTDDPPVNRHRPSVDYLFNSVAKIIGSSAVGVILTGMGNDGAAGLLQLKEAGAYTLGQDEKSCVVYGMPKAAFELGAVMKVVDLDEMSLALLDAVS